MKKGLSVIKYILLSLVLFFGGVMIEVSPTDFVKAVTQDVKDLTPDQKDDPDKAKDVQDQAQADDKDKEHRTADHSGNRILLIGQIGEQPPEYRAFKRNPTHYIFLILGKAGTVAGQYNLVVLA